MFKEHPNVIIAAFQQLRGAGLAALGSSFCYFNFFLPVQAAHSLELRLSQVSLTRLSTAEIAEQMQSISDWFTDGQQLYCTYQFTNFLEAIAFVNRLVAPSETLAHHPDLIISYNQVSINLTTHDAGGLTQLDFELARSISNLAVTDTGTLILCQPATSQ